MLLTTRYVYKCPFSLDAIGLDMPVGGSQAVNRAPFSGILTRVDEPSTRPPHGSQGHRVFIPRAVAEAALPTLLGMGIDVSGNFKDHAKQKKVGVITEAHIAGRDLVFSGHLYDKDFPEEVAYIQEHKATLGASYEISDVTVEDTEAAIWTLTGLTFTGAAILQKNAAAYQDTAIAAQAQEEDFMPGEGATILDELKKIGLKLDAALEEDASNSDEEDAAAGEEEAAAARSVEGARKAREEDDAEDAARHEAEASRLRLSAATRHEAAAVRRLAAGQALAAEETEARAREEAAAARHTVAAKRLRDEDAACKAERDADAAAKHTDEDDANLMPGLFAMLLKGMGWSRAGGKADAAATDGKAGKEGDAAMATMMGRMMLKAMAGGDAAHEDEAEDVALFKRLLRMHDQGDFKASARKGGLVTDDLDTRRLRRELRDLHAGMELITDTLKKQSGLLTDLVQKTKTLATDVHRPGQGGPVRKTMAAGATTFLGPFDGATSGDKSGKVTLAEINTALDEAGLEVGPKNNLTRMAKKIDAMMAGVVTDD